MDEWDMYMEHLHNDTDRKTDVLIEKPVPLWLLQCIFHSGRQAVKCVTVQISEIGRAQVPFRQGCGIFYFKSIDFC